MPADAVKNSQGVFYVYSKGSDYATFYVLDFIVQVEIKSISQHYAFSREQFWKMLVESLRIVTTLLFDMFGTRAVQFKRF